MKHRILPVLLAAGILLLGSAGSLQARLHLSGVFSDNMVLQREKPVAVWGTADPGATVEVRFGGQRVKSRADADGRWQLTLAPMGANATPQTLSVRCGRQRLEFRDVLVGEVWIASGQSNMEYNMGPVWRSGSTGKVDKPAKGPSIQEEEFRRADLPLLRTLIVEKVLNTDSLPTLGWQRIDKETIAPVSAAAYFFAKNLIDSLQVPVGILETCWGGTRIETWIPLEAMEGDSFFVQDLQEGSYDGEPVGRRFDRMVREMVPYTLRGMIWYQGESNLIAGNTDKYAAMQALLVRSWREAWGDDFSFYFVQIAPYLYSQRRGDRHVSTWEDLPRFWAQQEQSLSLIPHSGMAMVCDLVDNLSDIHPTYKWELGRRLALQALKETHGRRDLVADGPCLVGVSVSGPVVTVEFDQPLSTTDGQLPRHFRLAGSTGNYYEPSNIRLEGTRVILSNPIRVREPAEVRYAWDEAAVTNLCGLQGLPARQFSVQVPKNSYPGH